MKIEIGENFPAVIEAEGTVMDFVDGEFVFVIKDELWTPYELEGVKRQPLTLDFVYKYDIAIFLLGVEDTIDTSDFIFNVHDNTYEDDLFHTFAQGSGYVCTLYLLDKENIVRGRKRMQLSSHTSQIIASKLKEQKESDYHEEEFACNLKGLQTTWEPFEMQPMALVSETII